MQSFGMVEVWNFCRIYMWWRQRGGAKYGAAVAIVPDPASVLEPGMKVTLLLRNRNGEVFQVVDGTVRRRWKRLNYVEVYIPWHVAEALAEWAGKDVKNAKRLALHDYVVQIKEVSIPPLRSSTKATRHTAYTAGGTQTG
jgi:hypothetical protein